ncbi:phenazine biosynthesis-like domain-containing protein [Babylonia areolata]|uniref:phenazine biosynthesis-like domain-containing protein n=1 Tax=Babylonia areolata TaxID=304850 RepID=UPI003FD62676
MTTTEWGKSRQKFTLCCNWDGKMAGSKKKELKLYTVDAFASQPFSGNPAAVCLLQFGIPVDDRTLQNIATEMNLSETAFVLPLRPQDDHKTGCRFGLRWFTPRYEINLCGHATMASAAVLFYEIDNESEEITFETLSGELVVKREGDYLAMDFPLGTTEKQSISDYDAVIKSLGEVPSVQSVHWCPSIKYLMLHLEDGVWARSEFEKWRPDIGQLESSLACDVIVIATTRGSAEQGYVNEEGKAYDFVSRVFAPGYGVPEDPVCGSAQTALAHYWGQMLGKKEFYTRQCSQRGGEIDIKVRGSRVCLRGKATLVMKGVLRI